MSDIKNPDYQFDQPDRQLMEKVRKAVRYFRNGDPIKDALDDDDIAEALVLLVNIVDGEQCE